MGHGFRGYIFDAPILNPKRIPGFFLFRLPVDRQTVFPLRITMQKRQSLMRKRSRSPNQPLFPNFSEDTDMTDMYLLCVCVDVRMQFIHYSGSLTGFLHHSMVDSTVPSL